MLDSASSGTEVSVATSVFADGGFNSCDSFLPVS